MRTRRPLVGDAERARHPPQAEPLHDHGDDDDVEDDVEDAQRVLHAADDGERREHDRHRAAQPRPGEERALAPVEALPEGRGEHRQRSRHEHQREGHDDRLEALVGQPRRRHEQPQQDEQADLRDPARRLVEAVHQPGVRQAGRADHESEQVGREEARSRPARPRARRCRGPRPWSRPGRAPDDGSDTRRSAAVKARPISRPPAAPRASCLNSSHADVRGADARARRDLDQHDDEHGREAGRSDRTRPPGWPRGVAAAARPRTAANTAAASVDETTAPTSSDCVASRSNTRCAAAATTSAVTATPTVASRVAGTITRRSAFWSAARPPSNRISASATEPRISARWKSSKSMPPGPSSPSSRPRPRNSSSAGRAEALGEGRRDHAGEHDGAAEQDDLPRTHRRHCPVRGRWAVR